MFVKVKFKAIRVFAGRCGHLLAVEYFLTNSKLMPNTHHRVLLESYLQQLWLDVCVHDTPSISINGVVDLDV